MILALVDCNNFYASCEQLFDPRLRDRALVVLSNNDGCVVARSARAKEVGIPMGAPWHQLKDQARRHRVVALSSNYALYGDLSARVMQVLSGYSPQQEVYSIDECFLDLTGALPSPAACGRAMRSEVLRLVGLPVSVGLGPTKTLAKLANHFGKKRPEFEGVCPLHELPAAEQERLLAQVPASEVWGVGRRISQSLEGLGIRTALQLKKASPAWIRRQFSVTLERTVRELNSEPCLELMAGPARRRQILCSRSFGTLISELAPLEEAAAAFARRATEKLRDQKLLAGSVSTFLRTNPHREDHPQHFPSLCLPVQPTDDLRRITAAALNALRRIYRSGYAYQKTGVILTDLTPVERRQGDLFDDPVQLGRSQALMEAMEHINRSMGSGTVKLMAEGSDPRWAMKADNRTPRYTTRLDELPVAKAVSRKKISPYSGT